MKKNIFSVIIFFIFSISLFAAKIDKINVSSNKLIFNLSSTVNDEIIISADEDTRLVYLEILNLDKKSINRFTASLERDLEDLKLFDTIAVDRGETNLSLTLHLESKVAYNIDSSNKKIILSFSKTNKNKHLIVIDPGHGGKDPGAVRGSTREKDIVLTVGKFLKDELSEDFNVIMTRSTDVFIQLPARPKLANSKNAKLFVSIHANAAENKKANGVEVFYFSKKSSPYAERIANFENSFGEKYGESSDDIAQISGELAYKKNQENSINLANDLVGRLASAVNLRKGGVHGANFAVLRGFNGTGVLIELGFVSNAIDRKVITNRTNQKIMAQEIATSIRKYFE